MWPVTVIIEVGNNEQLERALGSLPDRTEFKVWQPYWDPTYFRIPIRERRKLIIIEVGNTEELEKLLLSLPRGTGFKVLQRVSTEGFDNLLAEREAAHRSV